VPGGTGGQAAESSTPLWPVALVGLALVGLLSSTRILRPSRVRDHG
jgi:hypothetical protein